MRSFLRFLACCATAVGVLIPAESASAWGGGIIAFDRYTAAAPDPDVWTLHPDESHMQVLVSDALQPSWSPDGRRLAFIRVGRTPDLFIARADGTVVRRVTHSRDGETDPAWSPDGTQLAYVRSHGDFGADIWIVSLGSGDTTRVTFSPSSHNRGPAWSPDGRWIAFTSTRNDIPPGGTSDVFVKNVRTGRLVQYTSNPAYDWDPSWSPDGRSIRFLSTRSGSSQVWQLTGTTGRDVRLTGGVDLVAFASSPDGRELVVSRHAGAYRCYLWIIHLHPRVSKQLTHTGCAEDVSWARVG